MVLSEAALKAFIEDRYNQLFADWTCSIPFPAYIQGKFLSECNILQFVGKKAYRNYVTCVRFCPSKYPVEQGLNGDAFKQLSTDIGRAAIDNGFQIAKNGNYPFTPLFHKQKNMEKKQPKVTAKRFSCVHNSQYRGSITGRQNLDYRDHTYHSDRKNSRGLQGSTMCRRSNTFKSYCKHTSCSFFFLIAHDDISFYVVNGLGNVEHCNHSQLSKEVLSYPARLLKGSEKELIKDLHNANANKGLMRNVIYEKTGQMLTLDNMAYVSGLCNSQKQLHDINFNSTTDKMLHFLAENQYDHMVLVHDPVISAVVNEVKMDSSLLIMPAKEVIEFASNEQIQVDEFVADHRESLRCLPHQLLLMAVVWVIPCERKLFEMFPEVIKVDCTNDTNNESRPLLTMTGKDSNGKCFTLLRAFLPNQQNWVFRWIFSVVLPQVFGADVLHHIKVIISDGDANEMSQIDSAISMYMPHVYRVRCGWHIVDRGWEKHIVSGYPEQAEFYSDTRGLIKEWIYSFMNHRCETRAEYKLSKKLLKEFVHSPMIESRLGSFFASNFDAFFRKNVETHEAHYLFYQRKHLRHYEEYSNSSHEGTNKGLKYCASPVTPNTRMDNSCAILSKQGVRSITSKKNFMTKQFRSTKPHTKLGCSNSLVEKCECALQHSIDSLTDYECIRITSSKWLVRRVVYPNSGKMIPIFARVRTVTLTDNNVLRCSCPRTSVYGDICVHALKVAYSVPGYTGPKYTDFSVIWWKSFYHLASQMETRNKTIIELSNSMMILKEKQTCGLHMDPDFFSNVPYSSTLHIPDEYEYDENKPFLMNVNSFYDSVDMDVLNQRTVAPCDLSQISSCSAIDHTKMDSSTIHQLVKEHGEERRKNDPSPNVYNFLYQTFKDLVDVYQGQSNVNELMVIKKYLNKKGVEKKKENYEQTTALHNKENDLKEPKGTYVSCNVSCGKKRITHGVAHYACKKKKKKSK